MLSSQFINHHVSSFLLAHTFAGAHLFALIIDFSITTFLRTFPRSLFRFVALQWFLCLSFYLSCQMSSPCEVTWLHFKYFKFDCIFARWIFRRRVSAGHESCVYGKFRNRMRLARGQQRFYSTLKSILLHAHESLWSERQDALTVPAHLSFSLLHTQQRVTLRSGGHSQTIEIRGNISSNCHVFLERSRINKFMTSLAYPCNEFTSSKLSSKKSTQDKLSSYRSSK